MSGFRAKQMTPNELGAFQNHFQALFMATGSDKRMALFMRSEPGDDISTILIPSFNSEAVEALSPAGWADFTNPQQQHWALVIGHASAPEDFGITLGV